MRLIYSSLLLLFLYKSILPFPSRLDNESLNRALEVFQGATSIQDYVLHFGQEIPIYLDHHFLGQNPTYSLITTPPTDLIKLEPFLVKFTPQKFSQGNAVISYIGYCHVVNRHVLFILTDLSQLYAYLMHISHDSTNTSDIVQKVTATPLDIKCEGLGQLDCSQIFGDIDDLIILGCVVRSDSSPVLVSVDVIVKENQMHIIGCNHFPVTSDQQSLNIKYVNPNTNFLVLEVEQSEGTNSQVHDYFIPFNNSQSSVFYYNSNDIGLVQLNADFFRSQIAQPLNIHGYAQIGQFVYVFNEMSELYILKIQQSLESGFLTVIQPPPDSTQYLRNYRVKRVMQASIWDEAPNRILVEALDQRDGARIVIELVIDLDNPELPITNSVYQNLNPDDSFFLNVRGNAMENENYIFQEMYQNDKKFFLRVFSKSLPFYNMPISDYYVTTYGFLQALFVDYYADLILILEDQQFFLCKIKGNALSLGKRGPDLLSSQPSALMPQFRWPWQKPDTDNTTPSSPVYQENEHKVFVYQQTGFATENTMKFNTTFLVKFIHEGRTDIYKTDTPILGAYEIGRLNYFVIPHKHFIGPNVSLSFSFSKNQTLPQSYIDKIEASILPLFTPVKLRIENPMGFMPQCINYTYFAAVMSGQEMVSMVCISQYYIYAFFAPVYDRVQDDTKIHFSEPIIYPFAPFEILDYVSDHDQHLIILLTAVYNQKYIQVIQFALIDGELTLIWRAKSGILPHHPKFPSVQRPSLFYSPYERILLILSHYEQYIMSYKIEVQGAVIIQKSIFRNPYYLSLFHGSLICIHFLHHQFLLIIYEDALVIARGDYSSAGIETDFEYFKKFLQNMYIHVAYAHQKLLLFQQATLSLYDFNDPFLPSLLRVLTIPYVGYHFYQSPKRGLYVTTDLHHLVVAIVQKYQDKTFHLLAYRTNTQMAHNSLLFVRPLEEDFQEELRNDSYMFLYGCKCQTPQIADPNILFFSLETSVVMTEIHLDHILKIKTPTLQISSTEPLNLIIKPDRGCINLSNSTQPCELHLPLFGEMSGTVVKLAPEIDSKHSVDITFIKPEKHAGIIMDSYFQGFDLTFSIDEIKSDPKALGTPLLTVPKFVCHFDIPSQWSISNITNHFFISTANLMSPVLVTFDIYQTINLHITEVRDGDWVQVLMLQTLTLKEFDQIKSLLPLTSANPPSTFWLVYGTYKNTRRLVVYNTTSIYTVHSQYFNLSPDSLANFLPTQIIEPWYIPLRWFFDPKDGFLLISYSYDNRFDEPLLFFRVDFVQGKIEEITMIGAVLLRLNIFSSSSFFIHNQYPLLVAAGKGAQLTLVDLTTQTYLHSIDITDYDEVLKTVDDLDVAWLRQSGPSEFHAFIQGYGVLTFNITMLVPYNDIDNFDDISITLLQSIHERGKLDAFRPLENPFAQAGNLILGLFLRTQGQYQLKLYNSYEAKRSKVLYSIYLAGRKNCFRPYFFRPPDTKIGEIFGSLICGGQLLIFKLSEFFYLTLDSELINGLDPSLFPVSQVLSIRAHNPYDTLGVTLDFNVNVLQTAESESNMTIGVTAVIIFLLITVFLVIAWRLRNVQKRKMSIPKAEVIEIQQIIREMREEEEQDQEDKEQAVGSPGEVELTTF